MEGSIILFEDQFVDDMQPVTLTRPAFGVTCACYNLYEVAAMASPRVSYIVRGYLEKTTARCFSNAEPASGPRLFVNASVAPDVRYVEHMRRLIAEAAPFICTSGQRVAAALIPADQEVPEDLTPAGVTAWLLDLDLPLRGAELFATLDFPFHVVKYNIDLFPAGIERRIESGRFEQVRPGVFTGEDVTLPDSAVFHVEEGPVVLDEGVRVLDFTFFSGPVYVGPRSRIIERSSIKEFTCTGHTCKIGGELEATVIEPYTNKQHHGFLGHAYVGSWVNMGAGTSNSDLKNTYGVIRVLHRGKRLDTGMRFLGCIIGDYVKTAINTSIFTGKIIGIASMLYGLVGQNVPSFCNYAKSFGQITECPLEQTIVTQRRMFARRDIAQTEDDIALLRTVYELTRNDRMISEEPPVF